MSFNIFQVCAVTHVKVVVLVREISHYFTVFHFTYNVGLHQHTVSFIPRHKTRPHVALVIFEDRSRLLTFLGLTWLLKTCSGLLNDFILLLLL
jgi:hypothetical protein